MAKQEEGLPRYAVELDAMTFQGAAAYPHLCPSCTKPGAWRDGVFVPDNEKIPGYPACPCKRMHEAGAYAFDPATKTFLRRQAGAGDPPEATR